VTTTSAGEDSDAVSGLDDPGQLPLVARELAGYPPAMPMRAPHPRDLPGGVSPMQATATEMMARMLGTPPSTPAPSPQRIGFGPRLAIKGPPMETGQLATTEAPDTLVASGPEVPSIEPAGHRPSEEGKDRSGHEAQA
jgi:hypothetical protein